MYQSTTIFPLLVETRKTLNESSKLVTETEQAYDRVMQQTIEIHRSLNDMIEQLKATRYQ